MARRATSRGKCARARARPLFASGSAPPHACIARRTLFPFSYNLIADNLCHELGIWEKQSSCYTQFKSAFNTIRGNIMYNGPRANVNFNDGLGGGALLGTLLACVAILATLLVITLTYIFSFPSYFK